ncbi:MAG: hypothetical protein J7513_07700 [Solirubrobacteraceae bacterium]|nr:hypothetical protein [Solirubrobacteraceae bacterium]
MSAITFICPHCGHRSVLRDRVRGLRGKPLTCERCGAGMLFELLDDYYPAPQAAMFVLDQGGRVLGCGRGSFELTGLKDERAIGRDAKDLLGLVTDDGADVIGTVREWGVRQLNKPATIEAEGDLPARVTVDCFPAYDDDGGVLLVLTPSE